jgi:hypothetical protein
MAPRRRRGPGPRDGRGAPRRGSRRHGAAPPGQLGPAGALGPRSPTTPSTGPIPGRERPRQRLLLLGDRRRAPSPRRSATLNSPSNRRRTVRRLSALWGFTSLRPERPTIRTGSLSTGQSLPLGRPPVSCSDGPVDKLPVRLDPSLWHGHIGSNVSGGCECDFHRVKVEGTLRRYWRSLISLAGSVRLRWFREVMLVKTVRKPSALCVHFVAAK